MSGCGSRRQKGKEAGGHWTDEGQVGGKLYYMLLLEPCAYVTY